jgi:hypothetical protein
MKHLRILTLAAAWPCHKFGHRPLHSSFRFAGFGLESQVGVNSESKDCADSFPQSLVAFTMASMGFHLGSCKITQC